MSVTAIKCARCKNYHASVADVKACCMGRVVVPPQVESAAVEQSVLPSVTNGATRKQLDYINDLGGDVQQAAHYTQKGASIYITRLQREKREKDRMTDPLEAPNRKSTIVPLDMLKKVPDGYYASRPDDLSPFTFFRVSRPKATAKTEFAGCLKIQTQHGPELKLALVVWRDGTVTVYNKAIENDLLLVVVDVNGTALAYAEELKHCMRCNTELTDERSRWFGIGPECEKHRPHVIDIVTDTKGPFVHGWEKRD